MKPAGDACLQCPARDAKCVLPEPARSPGRVKLAVVGEAPGRDEVREGRPFIGASGRLMMRELKRLGPSRADVHWTNAVLCECPKEDQAAAAKACSERLRKELEAINPVVVLPVGAWGLSSTLGAGKKLAIIGGKNRPPWRGSVSVKDFGKKGLHFDTPQSESTSLVVPTVHPAFILRGGDKWKVTFQRDVERAVRLVFEKWEAPEEAEHRTLTVPKTLEQLRSALELLGHTVSFDVETVGLGPTETELVCFGVSDGILTVVVPWSLARDGSGDFWNGKSAVAADVVSRHLRIRRVVTHNGFGFDHIVAARYGIDLGDDLHDTLNLYHVLESGLPKNLAHVCTQFLDVPPWKSQEDRTADLDRLYIYNGRDCLYTLMAFEKMMPMLEAS